MKTSQITVLACALLLALSGCGNRKVVGKYKGEVKFMHPIDAYPATAELSSNGNLFLEAATPYRDQTKITMVGTYEVDGERLIFKTEGQSLVWNLEGKRLSMPDGSYLQKQ